MIPSDKHAPKYRDRWLQAVKSTREHLIHTSPPVAGDTETHYWLHQWRNGWLLNEMGHLTCFAGGNWLLGGAYLRDKEIMDMGIELVKACRAVYAATTTGIGPEYWQWYPSDTDGAYSPTHGGQWDQLKQWGWWITDARWMLRPETVESYFYAYRITGDKKFQDWAWEAFVAYEKAAKAEHGYAEVKDVTLRPGEDNIEDKAESFWGAETLKYLWLTFCDEDVASLDEWVFSTGEFFPASVEGGGSE
jgi:mannosyl-oligosaccharide alpha-1,2-mannosidase